ncbi:hypothetical protein B0H10DRAFT_1980218 [Mycena sp. CBHHK59/15]|nr:hypothetical protein B0H10DRAFT_1980218 [Mycena sp. CBHHK59/15]
MNPLQLTFVLALLAMVISAPLGLEGSNDAPSSAEDEGTPPTHSERKMGHIWLSQTQVLFVYLPFSPVFEFNGSDR